MRAREGAHACRSFHHLCCAGGLSSTNCPARESVAVAPVASLNRAATHPPLPPPAHRSKLCLKNRHGEDIAAAEASDRWVCPRCRGSCGDGCVACCNCGPCRKALGLAPTHQIIGQARAAGFDNVHDYLVGWWAGCCGACQLCVGTAATFLFGGLPHGSPGSRSGWP
jgi:hypothetical protein